MPRLCEVKEKEYLDKKFEAAKEILPVMLDKVDVAYITDIRKRGSLIYNTVAVADHLLQELGYRVRGSESAKGKTDEATAIRKLEDMLKGGDKK